MSWLRPYYAAALLALGAALAAWVLHPRIELHRQRAETLAQGLAERADELAAERAAVAQLQQALQAAGQAVRQVEAAAAARSREAARLAAQAARGRVEADAQVQRLLRLPPPPAGEECGAALELIRQELAR